MFSCDSIRHTFYREYVTFPVSCLHCEAVTGTSRHQHGPGGRAQVNHTNLDWSLSLSPLHSFFLPFLTEITSHQCTKTLSNSLRSHSRMGPGPHQIPLAYLHWKWGIIHHESAEDAASLWQGKHDGSQPGSPALPCWLSEGSPRPLSAMNLSSEACVVSLLWDTQEQEFPLLLISNSSI